MLVFVNPKTHKGKQSYSSSDAFARFSGAPSLNDLVTRVRSPWRGGEGLQGSWSAPALPRMLTEPGWLCAVVSWAVYYGYDVARRACGGLRDRWFPLGNGLDPINTLHAIGDTRRRLVLDRDPSGHTRFFKAVMFSVAFSQFTTSDHRCCAPVSSGVPTISGLLLASSGPPHGRHSCGGCEDYPRRVVTMAALSHSTS